MKCAAAGCPCHTCVAISAFFLKTKDGWIDLQEWLGHRRKIERGGNEAGTTGPENLHLYLFADKVRVRSQWLMMVST